MKKKAIKMEKCSFCEWFSAASAKLISAEGQRASTEYEQIKKRKKTRVANKISNLIADRCVMAIAFVRTQIIHRPNYHCRRHQHFDHVVVWQICLSPARWYLCCVGRRTSSVWFVRNSPHPNGVRKRSAIIICYWVSIFVAIMGVQFVLGMRKTYQNSMHVSNIWN